MTKYSQSLDLSQYCTQSDPFILKQFCTAHAKPNMRKFWVEVLSAVVNDLIPLLILFALVGGLAFWGLLAATK